ncbi:hypothetical protein HNR23_000780 [Nocardiopsis mwathae]|uniref:Uncharacterized protein n=1 Tax=Nocardiopsis mwathae TaxID=1472723 RepID=A0A7X0D455_9ACTN|nr:hypothetical protein [Nocardiopsis mwathae]MBB6170720.1 hypothetical protein [Nocardiopsis mwathae]
MAPVMVEITPRPLPDEETDVEIIENIDGIASTEIMLGCGDDNPYR